MAENVLKERTLVVIKPDGVMRALIGKVIQRLENVGLKLVAAEMLRPTVEQIKGHYPVSDEQWVRGLGEKTLNTYSQLNLNVREKLGTDNPLELGKKVVDKLVDHWLQGPVVVMVWEGPHAVEVVRKLRGVTTPLQAEPGSILGDLSFDSQVVANLQDRSMKTFVHATTSSEEAEREITHWFKDSKFFDYYNRTDHAAMF